LNQHKAPNSIVADATGDHLPTIIPRLKAEPKFMQPLRGHAISQSQAIQSGNAIGEADL